MTPTETEKLKNAFAVTMAEAAEKIPARLTKAMIEQLTTSIPHIQEVGTNLQECLDDDRLVWPFVGVARFYEEQSAFQEAQEPAHEAKHSAKHGNNRSRDRDDDGDRRV